MEFGFTLTILATIAAVAVGLFNPIFSLMVYYAFSILRPQQLWFWITNWPIERLSFCIALVTIIGWAGKSFGNLAGLRAIWLPLLGLGVYLLSGAVAMQISFVSQERAWDALLLQLKIGLMAWITVTLIKNEKHLHIFAYLIAGTLGYLAWVFNSAYYFDGWNRIWPIGFGGVDNNGIAMIMVMGIPVAFFLAVNTTKWWIKVALFLAVACEVHAVLFSFSRSAQLGLVIVTATIFVIALVRLPRKGLTVAIAVIFVALGLRLAGTEVRDRFSSIFNDAADRDVSAASRFATWSAAWGCMKDHPLGVGPRNFNLISDQYGLVRNKSVHSLFLQTGADYGILGMVGLATFYFATMFKTFKMASSDTARRLVWPRYYGHMVCVSLGGFLVCSIFIGMESIESGYIISLLGLCTVMHVDRIAQRKPMGEAAIPKLEQVPVPDKGKPVPV